MVKYKILEGEDATARFLEETCDIRVLGITQERCYFTIFYKE